jgi:hypothetical protein
MNVFRERRQVSAGQSQAKRPGARKGRPKDGAKVAHVLSIRKSGVHNSGGLSSAPTIATNSFVFARFEVNVPPVFSPFQRNSGENLIDLR